MLSSDGLLYRRQLIDLDNEFNEEGIDGDRCDAHSSSNWSLSVYNLFPADASRFLKVITNDNTT